MKKPPINGLQAIYVFIGGLMGTLPAANCVHGSCTSCYGCAGIGIMAIFFGLVQKIIKTRKIN